MVVFVIGVSGTGKTTVGKLAADKMGVPFFDADDYHELANIEKMKSGIPLTDSDRIPWLKRLNKLARDNENGCVIACSALKEKYRTTLCHQIETPFYWVFLQGGYDQILERIKLRADHFMGAEMLKSQLDILEEPVNSILMDVSASPNDIVERVIERIK